MADSRRVDHSDEPGVVLDTEFYWETEICLNVSILGQEIPGSGLTPLAPVLSICQPR